MKNIPIRYLKASENLSLRVNFDVRNLRELLAGKDMKQELHRHDYFYILALEKARGIHEIDFTSYQVRNHSVFFMRPGQVHQLTLKAGSTGYLMQFKKDFFYPADKASAQLLRNASNQNLCALNAASFKRVLSLLSYIFQEYIDQREGYHEVIKANLGIFFIELVRHRRAGKGLAKTGGNYSLQRLDQFVELLERHVHQHKQVSRYADMLHLSTYQLNAITREALGKTSSQLINEYIVLESKRLLLATSDQVNQIAYHLGYEDVSYFIRFFKKHTGYSPEAFRDNFR